MILIFSIQTAVIQRLSAEVLLSIFSLKTVNSFRNISSLLFLCFHGIGIPWNQTLGAVFIDIRIELTIKIDTVPFYNLILYLSTSFFITRIYNMMNVLSF